MKTLRRLTFLTQLMLGLGLTLVIVGTVMAVGNYFISVIPLEHRMQEKARLTCWRFSQALRKHVWNMDDTALARYFAYHPSELSGLVSIRVLTEFEDPIFTRQFSQETDLISCRSEVRYEGQLVGYIEADLNGHELQLAHEAIARSGVLIVSSGIVAILLAAILEQSNRHDEAIEIMANLPPASRGVSPRSRYAEWPALGAEASQARLTAQAEEAAPSLKAALGGAG